MARDFSGANTDDIRWAVNPGLNGTGNAFILAGWWRFNSLTSGRFLWVTGSGTGGIGAAVHSTTSELKLYGSNATTREVRLTSGLGLTTAKWQFLAFYGLNNAGGTSIAWAVWRGSETEAPAEITVNASVTGVGTNGSGNAITMGNEGSSASLAHVGQIGHTYLTLTGESYGQTHPFASTQSTHTTDSKNYVLQRFVHKWWQGQMPDMRFLNAVGQSTFEIWPAERDVPLYRRDLNNLNLNVSDLASNAITTVGSVMQPRVPVFNGLAGSRATHRRR